jgi:1,4-alpha-glucan branching enzyme
VIQIAHEQDDLSGSIPLKTFNIEKQIAMNIHVKRRPSATARRLLQTFELAAPAAKHVELVGDFTHWQQSPIHLHKSFDGLWRASVVLELGRHEYRFLVDDQWCDDPKCAIHVPNPYGGQNDVRQVI